MRSCVQRGDYYRDFRQPVSFHRQVRSYLSPAGPHCIRTPDKEEAAQVKAASNCAAASVNLSLPDTHFNTAATWQIEEHRKQEHVSCSGCFEAQFLIGADRTVDTVALGPKHPELIKHIIIILVFCSVVTPSPGLGFIMFFLSWSASHYPPHALSASPLPRRASAVNLWSPLQVSEVTGRALWSGSM